jgi:hypothetical protein
MLRIAGEPVPVEDARQTWRQTSVRMCALSGFYADFFPAIRAFEEQAGSVMRLTVDREASAPKNTLLRVPGR